MSFLGDSTSVCSISDALTAFLSNSLMLSSEDLNTMDTESSESTVMILLTRDTSFELFFVCSFIEDNTHVRDNNNKHIVSILYIL